jgi:predicted nucleic acid-binding protein
VILLDTSVVSAVLRRRKRGETEESVARKVGALLAGDEEVALPGIVFQEVLSGIADRTQHEKLLASIRESFPIALATEGDHIMAADLVTQSARRGVARAPFHDRCGLPGPGPRHDRAARLAHSTSRRPPVASA